MKYPPEFRKMALYMFQDIDVVLEPDEDLFDYLIGSITEDERVVVKEFLTELLASDLDPKDMEVLWVEAGADWSVSPMDKFLSEIRDRIPDRPQARSSAD